MNFNLIKKIIFIVLISASASAISQDKIHYNTIYDNAPENIKLQKPFLREKWFYEQRMFPLDYIPVNEYHHAYSQKMILRSSKGFFYTDGFWQNIGPTPGYNTNYGFVSSRIATIKFDHTNPEIVYIGAANGGVWKSTNGGLNWFSITDFEVSTSSGALAIDNKNTNIIYYGTGEATYFTYSYYGKGLLKSTDAGNAWKNYIDGLPDNTYFSRIVIKPDDSNVLFAALGTAGLYKSTDAGHKWSRVISGRCDDVIFAPNGEKVYIIGEGCGYRVSNDGGNTFTNYNVFNLGLRNHIALCKSSPNVLYASIFRNGDVFVYKSTNSGFNYSLLPNTFLGANQAWYDFYIHVNPHDPDNAYVGLIDLWRTTNGKDFFKITNTSAGPVHVDHHNMDFHPTNPDILICANDGGVYKSTNRGNNWINLNYTLTLTQFYRITSDPRNSSHIIGGTQDNGTQRTTGAMQWNVVIGGDGGDVCFNPNDVSYILAETQFNGIRRSVNGGFSWVLSTDGLTGQAAWIAPIIAHPDSNGIFYTARQQVFKTTNNGYNWFPYSSGINGTIRELAISKSEPKYIYGSIYNLFFKSSDGGITFYNKSDSLPPRIMTSINVHPDSPEVVLITYSGFNGGHVFKTTNGGDYWYDVSGDLPDVPVNDGLIYYPGYSTSIFLTATDVGVFFTNDYGNRWFELANGLPNTVSMHLDYNEAAKVLRVGTHGRGVWEFNGNIIGIVNRSITNPDKYMLYQNYPNPFNIETKIKFQMKEEQHVRMSVFDLLGRVIKVLVNEKLTPGTYEVNFDGSKLASGVYYYRMELYSDRFETKGFSYAKQMVLIK